MYIFYNVHAFLYGSVVLCIDCELNSLQVELNPLQVELNPFQVELIPLQDCKGVRVAARHCVIHICMCACTQPVCV